MITFPGLASCGGYRTLFGVEPEFVAADRVRGESGCVPHYERTFMRLILPAPEWSPLRAEARTT